MTGRGLHHIIAVWYVSVALLNLLANAEVSKKNFNPENLETVNACDMEEHVPGMGLLRKGKDSGYNISKNKATLCQKNLLQYPAWIHERPPPATVGKPTKVAMDDSSSDTEYLNITDGGRKIKEGSSEDEYYSRYFVLTRSGYEYEGSKLALESIFSSIQLKRSQRVEKNDGNQANKSFENSSNNGLTSSKLLLQSQRTVFPPDTRVMVNNTKEYPYSAIGRIGTGCTGTFVGPRHILTAGHCVFNRLFKAWQKNLDFRRAKTCDPNGGFYYKWKYAIITYGWKLLGLATYDYAMIVVEEPSPVWLQIGWKKPMPRYVVNINGYPGDKPGRCLWHSDCRFMWKSSLQLGYTCDTYNGMSGSSVYTEFKGSGQKVMYCIHTYGSGFSGYNKCTRITEPRFRQLKYWISKY